MMKIRPFLLMLLALLLAAPTSANAWWDSNWSFRKKITIDGGPMGGALLEDAGRAPVLVRLHDGNFRFTDAKDDGSDIRFIDGDDKTPLKFHIDTYDGVLGIALAWVDVPAVKAGSTSDIYIYYGNSKAPQGADPKGSYDADTALVYHFADRNMPPRDETAYNNAGEPAAISVDTSAIGRGIRLDGTNMITIPGNLSLALKPGAGFTWSAWVKPNAGQPNAIIYSKRTGGAAVLIGLDQDMPFVSIANGAAVTRTPPVAAVAPMNWHHIAVTASDRITLYIDGKAATTLAAALPALAGAATLGGDNATPRPAGFSGELDELEISKTARNAGFIQAAFISQGPDNKMLAFGQDEENSGFSTGYVGVILKSVTIDGWVVIGLLMVMAAISWIVMGSKARYISRVTRANEHFLELFTRSDTDMGRFATQLSATKSVDMENSVLFRICEAGGAELSRRIAAGRSSELVLTPEAVATIRASLDRVSTYESQRLNSLMVLLTIAVSGGPFLGLLGTVVGVMITFAAIAATGDVNINAIAPGIAAALVATVAGLGVAIPALFGYNYLITRIKDLTSEMHVFIDEFVTRLAESYSHRSGTRIAAE
jgi:biopolymer transport protein ExbB